MIPMEMETIQWYPGHMVKARKLITENLKLVDLAVELLDARIPASSRNPEINLIVGDKPRIIVLNKADLADQAQTEKWKEFFQTEEGLKCIPIDSQSGKGINSFLNAAQEEAAGVLQKLAARGRKPRPVRLMMLGIPNVGKSSLINRLAGRGSAKTGDRPGVTRGKQWIRVGKGLELLDTPGILWPKFEDPEVGLKLAVTGAIKDEIINVEQVSIKLIQLLKEIAPESLKTRYKLEALGDEPQETLKYIGQKRGCLVSGGKVDLLKAAVIVLNEFREGKIGLFTLDQIS